MQETFQEQGGDMHIPPLLDKAWKYFIFGLFVIAAPIFNFSLIEVLKPDWQDGRFASYLDLFLLPEASFWFFPLLVYAIVSYILLLWNTGRYAQSFIIRLGIYAGTFLALQYSLLTFLALEAGPFFVVILAFLSPLILDKIYRWSTAKWEAALIQRLIIGFVIVAVIASMILGRTPMAPFFFATLLFGISAPFWSFLIAFQASRWLLKHYETKFSFAKGLGIFAWLSAYIFALRFNILKMFELYNTLPTEPPNCYIATAAAKGHPRFVGSREVTLASGKPMRVNRQLQRLKALEIVLMAAVPNLHKSIRIIYDVLGKGLSSYIQNAFLADFAFVLLIPVELLSLSVLKLFFPEIESLSKHYYDR